MVASLYPIHQYIFPCCHQPLKSKFSPMHQERPGEFFVVGINPMCFGVNEKGHFTVLNLLRTISSVHWFTMFYRVFVSTRINKKDLAVVRIQKYLDICIIRQIHTKYKADTESRSTLIKTEYSLHIHKSA